MEIEKSIEGKNILVTGGTGSFGYQITSQLLKLSPEKVSIFSRDEKKQYDMKNEFEHYNNVLDFIIGDVRSYSKIHEAMRDIDIVYHAAALKQVPNCELHPFEAVKTNIVGAENVRRAAIENDVKVVVAVSTDKAVKPVNVMGMTKAIQEKIFLNSKNQENYTNFICVRYGNVIGSRGSVIPLFKKRIENNKYLPVTSYKMTRFLLRLEEAIDLVFKATSEGKTGQLFVKKMPACNIIDLAKTMCKALVGEKDYPIKEVGIRPGEKIHEVLVSEEEMNRAVETEENYVIYPFNEFKKPKLKNDIVEYSSDQTHMLNQEEILLLLNKAGCL